MMITNLSSQQLAQMFSKGDKNYQKIPIFKHMTIQQVSVHQFLIVGDRFIQAPLSLPIVL